MYKCLLSDRVWMLEASSDLRRTEFHHLTIGLNLFSLKEWLIMKSIGKQ